MTHLALGLGDAGERVVVVHSEVLDRVCHECPPDI